MMSGTDSERRSESRVDGRVTIFVERLAADYDGLRPASVIVCRSLDISANGLQVRMDQPVPVGAILRLCAQPPNGERSLYLVGEVRWVRNEGPLHCIGFSLYESEQTDIVAWKELIARQLTSDQQVRP